jgi:2-iminobutanoate/2-iminopropanoate deaminase
MRKPSISLLSQAFFIPLLWSASATAIFWSEPGLSAPVAAAAKPYSPAVRKGNTVYVAGQTPNDQKTGEIVGVTIEEQTKQVIQNIEAILTKEGMTLSNVVSTTVYLSDLNNLKRMNRVYAIAFGLSPVPPARTAIQISRLPGDALIEITVIAVD